MRLTEKEFEVFEAKMIELGYSKSNFKLKSECFSFWKSFHKNFDEQGHKEIGYQLAFLVYDWRVHSQYDSIAKKHPYAVQLEFLAGNKVSSLSRFDFTISDDKITIEKFEGIAEKIYQLLLTDFK
jgi:hypothetical protein